MTDNTEHRQPVTVIDKNKCRDLDVSSRLEWLETNGIGGYASSTVSGMNTRRYHGLLVAAVQPPAGRMVALSKLEETVEINGEEHALGVNRYPGAVHPEGYKYIESFQLDPFPRWVYSVGGHLLEKSFQIVYGINAAAVRYRWIDKKGNPLDAAPEGVNLRIRMFLAYRDYHHLMKAVEFRSPAFRMEGGAKVFQPYDGAPELFVRHSGSSYNFDPLWYYNFEYDVEHERGLDFSEDLLSPGDFAVDAASSAFIFSVEEDLLSLIEFEANPAPDEIFEILKKREIERREELFDIVKAEPDDVSKRLILSADSFIVKRGESGKSILAGYPWFTDWGRDAMIALPGLALVTGRYEVAQSVLGTFAKYIRHGLIPNRFPDASEAPAYNTVDAPLWYVIAADHYLRATNDYGFLETTLWQALRDIVHSYIEGTINNIGMDEDGLVYSGNAETQLTWMDAKVGDWVVTPRHGKAVEINAMWYNSLRVMERLSGRLNKNQDYYKSLARKVSREFSRMFWNKDTGCLFDVINEHGADAAIRPNQVFAISLPRMLLTAERRASVLEVIERDLLTPYGLRSLSPNDPAYRGEYTGGVIQRDGAYHQGTVWGWLIGHYVSAVLNVRGRSNEVIETIEEKLSALEQHLINEAGLNQISEIFSGDAPHTPAGCYAQAWSTAELIRARSLIKKI